MTCEFAKIFVKRLEILGKVDLKVKEMMQLDCFGNLSKHNEYFHSEHDIEFDKLDLLRRRLMGINDMLCEICELLEPYEE